MDTSHKVEISYKTIIFTVFFLIFTWFLYRIRYLLLLLFVAVIFMSALSPLVDKLEKRKIPRSVATLFFYILFLALIFFGVASLIPPLVEQTSKFLTLFPQNLNQLTKGRVDLSMFQPQLNTLPQQILKIALGVFDNIIGLFTFLVIVYYLIMERKNMKKYLLFLFGHNAKEEHAEEFIVKLEKKLGGWVRGQLTLMLIVGLMSYLGLTLLGVNFAIPLAFLAGLLEVIPTVGPTLSAIPAILVASGTSPLLALATLALYFVVQQVENQLIVPRVMSKAVGLSPLAVILALMAGFKIAGLAGVVLSVPAVLLMEIVFKDLYLKHYKK
ncbi:MAG: AI-2E family transporter [Candidatus Beckwithbacteria bacterium]|nr:AI-2E family transporter [Candidatus Beckwithbacteria bacterium]